MGSLLWTGGLLGIAHFVSLMLFRHFTIFFRVPHHALIAIAIGFMVAGLLQLRTSVSALDLLRERLAAVRDGRARRVEGAHPAEVEPLVNDLNALLEHREQAVSRAMAKAGDLAHGLKTPLAVLAQEAESARAAGQTELAATIEQQVDRMRRQVDYHLAQARAAASGATPGARCSVAVSAEALGRTLLRLHADRGLDIQVNVPVGHAVPVERPDLDEMLGNLLDNACKWAKSRVSVESTEIAGHVVVTVDDDGPGIAPSMRDVVLLRGVRADEAAPGSGLGLAIVRDLAELYGGSVALGDSPLGGLRASLRLPASRTGTSA